MKKRNMFLFFSVFYIELHNHSSTRLLLSNKKYINAISHFSKCTLNFQIENKLHSNIELYTFDDLAN